MCAIQCRDAHILSSKTYWCALHTYKDKTKAWLFTHIFIIYPVHFCKGLSQTHLLLQYHCKNIPYEFL